MTKTMQLLLLLLSLAAIGGCSQSSAQTTFTAASYQGKVDTTLSAELQAKQQALRKFLNAVLEGVGDAGGLAIYAPGIDFRAKYEDLNGTSGRLVRWDFNGRPSGNDVPVVLVYVDPATGLVTPENERKVEKTFAVVRGGNRFSISPK
jgi:hypothetical protein